MVDTAEQRKSWGETFLAFFERRLIAVLFLGFSSGLPLALTVATLQARQTEAGVNLTTIGFFALVGVSYSLKFVWAPLIDRSLPPGPFKLLGHRRGWTLLFQISLMIAISVLGLLDPSTALAATALVAVVVAFLSASQDIVIDAYRIEVLDADQQGAGAAMIQYGYRLGMLVSGAGALFIAEYAYRYFAHVNVEAAWAAVDLSSLDRAGSMALLSNSVAGLIDAVHQSWVVAYVAMAALMVVGVGTTFLVREPQQSDLSRLNRDPGEASFALRLGAMAIFVILAFAAFMLIRTYGDLLFGIPSFLNNFVATVTAAAIPVLIVIYLPNPGSSGHPSYIALHRWLDRSIKLPFVEIAKRDGWVLLLLFIVLYKLGDAVLGTMATPFYLKIGFSKPQIAEISKLFGLVATLLGVYLGGLVVLKLGMARALLITGVLQMLSNLMFAWQAHVGSDVQWLYATIGIENFTGGMASAAFVAYLSGLCNIAFTATHYALFSSLAAVGRTVIASPMGGVADAIGWVDYFLLSTAMAVPGLILLVFMIRRYPVSLRAGGPALVDAD